MKSLQCVLNSVAWRVLAGMLKVERRTRQVERVTAHVVQDGLAVTITVCTAGQQESEPIPGRWLSDAEQLVWRAIQVGQWLNGKEIAARCGREHDTKLKYLLLNLEDRGVLVHEDGKGYARAVIKPDAQVNRDDYAS